MFLWIKALHIISMVTWFAGLFYLPRLFVYHAMANDRIGIERFKIMERKLFFGIATPGAILTLLFGTWLLLSNSTYYMHQGWMHLKLTFVGVLCIYHLYLGKFLIAFKKDSNTHTPVFYRIFNEIPVIFLIAIVILVIVKP